MTRLARGFELLSLALVVGLLGRFVPVELVLDRVWGGAGPAASGRAGSSRSR